MTKRIHVEDANLPSALEDPEKGNLKRRLWIKYLHIWICLILAKLAVASVISKLSFRN